MSLVLAAPPFIVEPAGGAKPMQSTWTGPDGTVWDLYDWRSGLCLYNEGVTGLHSPRVEKFRSTSRAVPGFRPRGFRTESRDVFWPVAIYADGSDEWRERYAAFFDSIHPENPGIWSVAAGGRSRHLRLTGVFQNEHAFSEDPYMAGWSLIPVQLEPAQPYWEGDTVKAGPFGVPAPVDFIPEEGAPTFHLSQSSTFASASINNPGDVESWLVWTVRGPLNSIQLGVGDVTGVVPFGLLEGQTLRIDTDPRNVTATLDGVDATAALGLIEFGPVRPGENAQLSIEASGSGLVRAELTPLYWRAFGR